MVQRIDQQRLPEVASRQAMGRSTQAQGFRAVVTDTMNRRRPAATASGRPPTTRSEGRGGISLLHAQRLAHWAPLIKYNAAKYRVPIELICGVMLQESGGNPRARSHCGATGLMQLMPATARRFGVTDIWDPRQNVEGGVRYLRYLLDRYQGRAPFVIAAYNAGEGNVDKHGGIPPFAETRNYVPSVVQFARSVGTILRGGSIPMRAIVRESLPRHAIANFTPTPPRLSTPTQVAQRMVRL